MNLTYFIRLILKNSMLALGIAFAMAVLVYLMMGRKPKNYTSSTVIYTGIATGYDLESGENRRFDFYATNAQFDNIINIIKSREIQEETGIRLMAQHLMLEQPDPKICSEETWRNLMKEAPEEVKSLVARPNNAETARMIELAREAIKDVRDDEDSVPAVADSVPEKVTTTILESRTDTLKIEKFRETPKYYTVRAGDFPSSIASRFGISVDRLYSLNPGMGDPITGGQRLRVGLARESYFIDSVIVSKVPVQKDTLIQRAVPVTPDSAGKDYNSRMDSVTAAFDKTVARILEDSDPYEKTVANLRKYKNKDQSNYIYRTLQSSNPVYGVQKIASVKAVRIQSSDLLRLTFDSHDQGVCQNTLRIITQVFTQTHQKISASQTSVVSKYFRERVDSSKTRLDSLENQLLQFTKENRIINYNEQTKFIAEQKEVLDKEWTEAFGKVSAGKAALRVIEDNLDAKALLMTQNNEILDNRRKLHEINTAIAEEDVKGEISPYQMNLLKAQAERIKEDLRQAIARGYQFERTKEGINIQDVLSSWFQKAIEVEESKARYEVLTDRKDNFLKKYDEFAPLGSQMRKLEREIDLVQQDYMNHLHNLNLSIMKEKNIKTSEPQVLDEPLYPIKPNPSKRMFSVIAAFLAGLVITIAVIILMEFLDNTIKFPDRLAELSGVPLLGAFPRLPLKPDPKIDMNLLTGRAIDQITQRIRLEDLKQRSRGDQPFTIFIMSTREQEGKTFLGSRITEKLRVGGMKVLFIKPQEKRNPADFQMQFNTFAGLADAWDFEYEIPENFINIRNINELLRNFTFLTKGYQFIIIELPALLAGEFPAALVHTGNLSLLVGKASRTWNKADDDQVKLYSSSATHPRFSILNGCHVDQMETIVGEIPKRRSYIMKLIKKIINLDIRAIHTY